MHKDRELVPIRESEYFKINVSSLHFCPFCGSYNVGLYGLCLNENGETEAEAFERTKLISTDPLKLVVAQVVCDNCGARGPRFDRQDCIGSDRPEDRRTLKIRSNEFAEYPCRTWNQRIV